MAALKLISANRGLFILYYYVIFILLLLLFLIIFTINGFMVLLLCLWYILGSGVLQSNNEYIQ